VLETGSRYPALDCGRASCVMAVLLPPAVCCLMMLLCSEGKQCH